MALQTWNSIFQSKASDLRDGDTWRLEFDDSIVPDSPQFGWQQYIRSASARFKCSSCGRTWPSNRVMVVFHMRLLDGQGVVKVRRYRQNCKRCTSAPMEEPDFSQENIGILVEHLVQKIRIKCYKEDLGQSNRPHKGFDVKSPHEPSHCEGCLSGICTNNFSQAF